jgi:predicted nucleic acid-binding protein
VGLAAWAEGVGEVELFVSVVTVHELEHGVLLAERADPPRGAVLRRWLDDGVLQAFRDRVFVVDVPIARRAAMYHVPDPAPFRDALIAATAVEHDMTVVTRNVRDFERFGVRLHNPWN